jgi:mannose-6-phosphate isomerase-like protein (cupin superfamily)
MEEAMRLQGDSPFGWMLSLQTWLSARAAKWRERDAGRADRRAGCGEARLRLLRIDGRGVAAERDFDLDLNWAVLMLEGQMTLDLDGRHVPLQAGDVQVGSAGRAARIRAGGAGAFLLVDKPCAPTPAWPISVRGLA